jgi:hypothetical protein
MITVEDVEKIKRETPQEQEQNEAVVEKNKKKKLIKYVAIGIAGAVALYFVYTKVIVKKQPSNVVKAEL